MGFRKLVPQTAAKPLASGISATLRKGKANPARLWLTISSLVAAELCLSDGMEFDVLVGDGDNHGVIRLALLEKGAGEGFLLKKVHGAKADWFSLALGRVPQFIDRGEKRKWCNWERIEGPADEGFVEIVLPSWADETAPANKERVMAPVPLAATLPRIGGAARSAQNGETAARSAQMEKTAARRDNTAAINGDPAPGRSALDAWAIGVNEIIDRYGLSPQEARLLIALADGPSTTRQHLEKAVWGGAAPSDAALGIVMSALRRKVADIGFRIDNQRGVGWGLDAAARETVRVAMGRAAA